MDLPILVHKHKHKSKFVWDSATRKYIRKELAGAWPLPAASGVVPLSHGNGLQAASGADILSHSKGLQAASGASFLWRTAPPARAPHE
eukprot:156078-Pyramimonas_sp.AAC.1